MPDGSEMDEGEVLSDEEQLAHKISKIQARLKIAGYDVTIDGTWNASSVEAVEEIQSMIGVPVVSPLDSPLAYEFLVYLETIPVHGGHRETKE